MLKHRNGASSLVTDVDAPLRAARHRGHDALIPELNPESFYQLLQLHIVLPFQRLLEFLDIFGAPQSPGGHRAAPRAAALINAAKRLSLPVSGGVR